MRDGYIVALAWPETLCKQAGSWYDPIMKWIGVNKRGYYKVGHSAVLLIDDETRSCKYYDFGRYHAPHQYGRVRDEFTDHDLTIQTQVVYSDDLEIQNVDSILKELFNNPSTHGTGAIYAAKTRINIALAMKKIKSFQSKVFIPYGPFEFKGTNCSRFVASIIKAGNPKRSVKIKSRIPITISPTPMWNLSILQKKKYMYSE